MKLLRFVAGGVLKQPRRLCSTVHPARRIAGRWLRTAAGLRLRYQRAPIPADLGQAKWR